MALWYQIALAVPSATSDSISSWLFDLGCGGIQEEDEAGDGLVHLTAFFEDATDRGAVLRAVQTMLHEAHLPVAFRVEDVPETDWSASWRAHFKPIYPTARIAVCPPWDKVAVPQDGFAIVIEPKMAFGTGHHETTRLALVEMENCIGVGQSVLDVGTGSGILSIAAIKLGALRATAVETDLPAIENARENLVENGVIDTVDLIHGSVDRIDGEFDVVVANIISGILVPLLPELALRVCPNGRAILGGALVREHDAFVDAIESSGLVIDHTTTDGEWLCVTAHRE